MLSQADKIGADGTFKTRPILYEQVCIIMAWMKGNKGSFYLPAAFVLLGGKHKQTYILMLEELKKGVASLNLPFTPRYVSLDFELGAILAFIHCFPGIFIIGCWFHTFLKKIFYYYFLLVNK